MQPDDRFCVYCGQTTARVLWSASVNARPGEGAAVVQSGGTLYLVAANSGRDAVRVRLDVSQLRGFRLTGASKAQVDGDQPFAFALQHFPGESSGGHVVLFSEDAPRRRPSASDPNAPWWEVRAERSEQRRAQQIVRVVADRWIVGSPNLLFPPGVRTQFVRVWNDSERQRGFESDVPYGYRVTNYTLPLEKQAPDLSPFGAAELAVEAMPDRAVKAADKEWQAGPDREPIALRKSAAGSSEAGANVVIAIDFGTRNTGVRVRWRHEIVLGKPKGTVDIIGDRRGSARFPTEMALHRTGRTFRWGSDVPKGELPADEIRISNLKTFLRVDAEPYLRENPHWTNAYLLERYFEQIFVSIDDYFKAADPSLSRNNLDVRYVVCRPVLDNNEGDAQGKRYEQALKTALGRCGIAEDRITFVLEPVAAAYGIARRRSSELLALNESAPIAVVDAGGGTTDIAVARISLRDGRVTLDLRDTYAVHLDPENPALAAVQHFGAKDRIEFGGDVLDFALTYRLLTDAAPLLETEGRPVPPKLEVSAAPLSPQEKLRSESELVLSCRTMKEAFAYVSTHHLARAANQPVREHEHFMFANRPEYEGIYLEQSLFGAHVIAPILLVPLQEQRERMEQQGLEAEGIRPSQIKHVFYVGGTNIEFYLRQQFQELFPNSPRLQAETREGIEDRIAERLNAVVEGAVWCDEALFASSALDLAVRVDNLEKVVLRKGDPLPPESAAQMMPFQVHLEPLQELDAVMTAVSEDGAEPVIVARGFYRNTSDVTQDGTLQVRVSREKGVAAVLVINGRQYEQWRFALAEGTQ